MQQFTVPQFIDVEDKIIGPITVRQFLIMLAGFLLIGICYKLLDFSAFVVISLLIFGLSGTLAFAKINGRPFHYFMLNFIQTTKRARLRVWNHVIGRSGKDLGMNHMKPVTEEDIIEQKIHNNSRLAELSLIVDTQGAYRGEERRGSEIRSI